MMYSSPSSPVPLRLVVMGVSGCGKSEIGARLARRLGYPMVEGDAFHPQTNIDKMARGEPLNDTDRQGWLLVLQEKIREAREAGRGLVLSCSALKRAYRDLLRAGDPGLRFVHLTGERSVIANRMASRPGHFMPVSLLDSQLRDLEPPQADESAVSLDVGIPPDEMVERIVSQLELPGERS